MSQTGKFHVHTHRKNPRSWRPSQTSKFHVHTHRKNRLGQYLQSRNASDSSDHVVKIADRLGCLGRGVHTGRKNPTRRENRRTPRFLRFLGQVGTRLMKNLIVPDHVTFLNQVTYSSNLVQTELPIERKPNQITFG